MFGGDSSAGLLNQTWEYDGWQWTQMPLLPTRPSARGRAVMTYDAGHRRVILFGGTTTSAVYDNETWAYTGTAWTLLASGGSAPPGRIGGMLTYDAVRDVVVLFGGNGASGDLDDTWELADATWTQVTPVQKPPARAFGGLVYDAANMRSVLFGGIRTPGGAAADVWTYDGATWAPLATTNAPSPRSHMSVAYDAGRGTVVVFGGRNDPVLYDDTWELRGTTWSPLGDVTSPSARSDAALAYDARRSQLVLFGGTDFGNLDETWELGYQALDTLEACDAAVDYDGDAKLGCDDDDCAGVCVRCGDGVCDPVEAAACTADCP
jgi:hypothetical protein